jgi:hypothetical protein
VLKFTWMLMAFSGSVKVARGPAGAG